MRREHGQAAAVTVLFMTVLLLSAAAVIDVATWYREDRDTQRIADAAALAGAQELPADASAAEALALEYAEKNGGGVAPSDITFSTTMVPGDTISVEVDRPAPGFFSKVIGVDSVEVGSVAKARTGVPAEARWAAPIAVDEQHPLIAGCRPTPCFNEETTLDLQKVGPGAFRLLNIDGSQGGTGQSILAEWILRGYEGFMPLGQYYSDPGAKFNASEIKAAMDARVGSELLFPIYRTIREEGANLEYEVIGWIGFFVDGYTARGNGGTVSGYFTRVIWEGLLSTTTSGSPDFGVRSVALID